MSVNERGKIRIMYGVDIMVISYNKMMRLQTADMDTGIQARTVRPFRVENMPYHKNGWKFHEVVISRWDEAYVEVLPHGQWGCVHSRTRTLEDFHPI